MWDEDLSLFSCMCTGMTPTRPAPSCSPKTLALDLSDGQAPNKRIRRESAKKTYRY